MKDSSETRKIKSIAHNTLEAKEKSRLAALEVRSRPGVKEKQQESLKITYNTEKGKQMQWERRRNQILPSKDSESVELVIQKILTDAGIGFEKHIHVPIAENKEHGLPPTKEIDILIKPNKIIEVNGDYWHLNPKKYQAEQQVNLRKKIVKAKEEWEREELMLNKLRVLGYDILVVWEDDLVNDLEQTRKKIIFFLLSSYNASTFNYIAL